MSVSFETLWAVYISNIQSPLLRYSAVFRMDTKDFEKCVSFICRVKANTIAYYVRLDIYSVIQEDGLNFVSLYFNIRN